MSVMPNSTLLASDSKAKRSLQRFGGFLAGMVIPNIGAFIAWGLITALFIPTGWIPNASLATLVTPMITYLLPLLIGYTGGKMIADHRGGVVGAIATAGVVVGSPVPMFIGAMIMGPLGGYVIKKWDRAIQDKIPTGFEMLVNNFSAGILGAILAVLGYMIIGPVMTHVSNALGDAAIWVTNRHLLPLIAIFIEPGKVLFLNNAINHGVLSPLGIEQAKTAGKSVFFLLETDPGPGLGILLAYWLYGKGNAKQSAPSAIIIQFLGGIHEIYFPYILMKPILILAAIGGGMAADATFMLTHAGLVATPSPGSIFAEILMAPKGGLLPVLLGIAIGTIVSFIIAAPLLRRSASEADDLAAAQNQMREMKAQSKGQTVVTTATAPVLSTIPENIVFACEAGMGSSAMGASILRKKLKEAGFALDVKHIAVNQIPKDTQVVFTQASLADRAREVVPNAEIHVVNNFLDKATYDNFVEGLQKLAK